MLSDPYLVGLEVLDVELAVIGIDDESEGRVGHPGRLPER
jgi:hypothetical protein